MKLVLDTHALLWYAVNDPRLPEKVQTAIRNVEVDVSISIASLWEIGIKSSIGKLAVNIDVRALQTLAVAESIVVLPITIDAIDQTKYLDWFNKDSFDRMIAATAITRGEPLVTVEHSFSMGRRCVLVDRTITISSPEKSLTQFCLRGAFH